MAIKDNVRERLYGLSANRCNICQMNLFSNGQKIGEIAHIIAKNKNGPRGSIPFNGDIDDYENLILLCPNDHTLIDKNPDFYTREKILQIKSNHEKKIRTSLDDAIDVGRQMDVEALNALMIYLPFTQTLGFLLGLPNIFKMELFHMEDTCNHFYEDFPHCKPFHNDSLERFFNSFYQSLCNLNAFIYHEYLGKEKLYDNRDEIEFTNSLYLSKNLSYQEKTNIRTHVSSLADEFKEKFLELLKFLKEQYPEVYLSAYNNRG